MSKSGLCEVCQKRTTRRQWDEEQREFYFIHEKCGRMGEVIDFVFFCAAVTMILGDAEALQNQIAATTHGFSELVKQASGDK